MNSLLFPIAIFVPLFISSIQCLDLESAKEQTCFKINKTVPLMSDKWVLVWHQITVLSPHEPPGLVPDLVDLLEKDPADISESEVYYDSCILWKSNNETFFSEGFGGRTREYTAYSQKRNKDDDQLEEYRLSPITRKGFSGTIYTTYTDYKTFYFAASCHDDGQMTWGVGSLTPTLPQETVKLIHEHALSLGFKKEFFTELKYDRCNLQNDI